MIEVEKVQRTATRFDKTARNFLSTVHLAVSRFLLRRIRNQLFESTVPVKRPRSVNCLG